VATSAWQANEVSTKIEDCRKGSAIMVGVVALFFQVNLSYLGASGAVTACPCNKLHLRHFALCSSMAGLQPCQHYVCIASGQLLDWSMAGGELEASSPTAATLLSSTGPPSSDPSASTTISSSAA
jgi:hypothetical protein